MKKLQAWMGQKWSNMKAWMGRKWSKLKIAVYTLLVSLGLVVGVVLANDVNISWTNATTFTDGTPMSIDQIAETVLDYQMFALGTDVSAEPRTYVELVRLLPTVTNYRHANVANGIHCYVAYHVAKHVDPAQMGLASEYSNESCKTIDVRIPGSPSGMTAN